ncbi:hypothetical protein GCM10007198_03580 [Microbacterium aerolatum]|uniref:Glycosyl transferase family 1 domain-containing protein n=2 Tax=Microbacterium aerolatum TaxID=153731 RepID=A0A511ADI2_9MICO|nr:hypothetical protein MAE01_14040 [Microbacterium aerolatum]GGB16284.1 hypothetical protein GCM10007198_03580 [Microbacterium aerolatum]
MGDAPGSIELLICTREIGWHSLSEADRQAIEEVATVAFLRHSEMSQVLAAADIGMFITAPSEYMVNAVPVKVLDYFSYGLPVVATEGTSGAELVRSSGAGWVCGSSPTELAHLLESLQADPDEVQRRGNMARAYARVNTWTERALEVRKVLLGGNQAGK